MNGPARIAGFLALLAGFVASAARAQQGPPRFEAGAVIDYAHETLVEESNRLELGGRFTWNIGSHFGLDAEITTSPFSTVSRGLYTGGHATEGLFGAKYGMRWRKLGMFAKVRPGFVRYSDVFGGFNFNSGQISELGAQTTSPALEVGGIFEYYMSHRWMMRYDVGYTTIWYAARTPPLAASIPASTNGAFQYSASLAYRFGTQACAPFDEHDAISAYSHNFWDRENDLLFAGVAAVRAADYTSTLYFRRRGDDEGLLSNSIVDNHPVFAAIEIAGVAGSIATSYLFHRSGHHRIERWVSYAHITLAAAGDVANYTARKKLQAP
ncbi:MAG: hypothetical protein ACRD4S_13885 [Candidatus Acidiferrales bacterium]